MNTELMFSNKVDTWETPMEFFNEINNEFNFTLDPCCFENSAKCKIYFTPKENGLIQNWEGNVVFCNPPYSRATMGAWVKKCYDESKKPNTKVVMLIPARTDTRYFHDFIYKKAKEIRFIKGRLKFGDAKNSAPFPSMLVIF
jgi:phage N-6-adenine-methyltransferase